MVISIDHGNKCIKTENTIFTSGILESLQPPPLETDTIKLEDRYYCLTNNRIPYMRDKTTDDRFANLTLIAIAKELSKRDKLHEGITHDITLLCGLPPSHYSSQYEAFEHYLRMEKEFIYKDKRIKVNVEKVLSYPQAYAAAMSEYNRIAEYSKVIVIDIGGYTLDIIHIYDGEVLIDSCESLDFGVIPLYNQISSKLNSSYGISIDEREIDNVINEYTAKQKLNQNIEPGMISLPQSISQKVILLKPEVKDFIIEQTRLYVKDLSGLLRERKIDFQSNMFVFVGGGSILLYDFFERENVIKNSNLIKDIKANVRGYKFLYDAQSGE